MNIALDHLGFLGSNIGRMVDTFSKLGFQLTGPAPLDPGTGADVTAQQSAHVIFPGRYIELTAAPDCPADHHLAPFIGLSPGIRLLVLGCADADQERRRIRATGLEPSPVHEASRQLAYGDGAMARFRWFGLQRECLPGTLTGWVQHLTPGSVFDPRVMRHPNSVTGIDAVLLRRARLPEGLAATDGGTAARQDENLPEDPFIGGLELAAESLERCRAVLTNNQVAFSDLGNELQITAGDALGAELRIRQRA